ncbi:unnamed protein product [Rangifer tarandus platyrhynchus]|uniref:Uncharacterized protein n=2 Tax=Rangifer tarandus platyrhynchus TaxID=3082113 RepID=A0ABN8XS87_RANTA|nr:unnamed protein product [Rangifer tarandus platyrhynchus]CAI9690592.1 unnamed protein product [Rangifer tarandus platyrhynchus]
MPPRDWLCSPDRWWGAQLARYQPPPGASLSHPAAASLRLGPRRVIKHRPGPDPASFPSFLWPDWQVGTGDKDWGLRQFWGRQLHAPCPLSGQEHEVGRKVSASPAPQGPQDGVPTILVQLVGKGLRRLLERPGGVWGGGYLTPLLTHRATPAQPTTPHTFSTRTGQKLPQPLLVKGEGLEGKQTWQANEESDWEPPPPTPDTPRQGGGAAEVRQQGAEVGGT